MPELNGATIWSRKTLESDIFFWKPDKWFKIWFFLVNRVNHSDNKQFKRGSCFTTYSEISQYTKATKNQIDSFIQWSKEQSMLTTQKTTRGMVVFLLNYNKYQTLENYKTDTKTETKPKHNRNTTDTINKNDKNEKNNNILTAIAVDLNTNQTNMEEITYEYEITKKKNTNLKKLYSRIVIYYMGLVGKTGNAVRFFPEAKEIVNLAKDRLPKAKDEELEKEIIGSIDIANKYYSKAGFKDWGLRKVAENWNKILNEWI